MIIREKALYEYECEKYEAKTVWENQIQRISDTPPDNKVCTYFKLLINSTSTEQ